MSEATDKKQAAGARRPWWLTPLIAALALTVLVVVGLGIRASYVRTHSRHSPVYWLRRAGESAVQLQDRSLKGQALREVVPQMVRAGDLSGADAVAARDTDGPMYVFYVTVKAQVKRGVLRGAERRAKALQHGDTVCELLGDIQYARIKQYARNGDLRRAEEIARRDTMTGLPSSDGDWGLSTIAEQQAKRGDIAGARATAARIEDPVELARTLTEIAAAQRKAGELAASRRTLEQARTLALDSQSRRNTEHELQRIAVEFARGGDIQAAKATAANIPKDSERAFTAIAIEQARLGDVQGALLTTLDIGDAWAKTAILLAVAKEQAREHNTDDCRQTLDWAEAMADKVKEPYIRIYDLSAIAKQRIKLGEVENGQRTFDKAVAIAEALGFSLQSIWELRGIAKTRREVGDIDGHLTTLGRMRLLARQIQDTAERERAFLALIEEQQKLCMCRAQAMVRAGRLKEAETWIDSLSDPLEKTYAELGVALGLMPERKEEDE